MKTFSTREAAKLIGVDHHTLEQWIRCGVFRPSISTPLDATRRVWRWTETDVEKARKLKLTRKPGPKPKKVRPTGRR